MELKGIKMACLGDSITEGVGVTGAASGELFDNGLIQTASDSYAKVTVEIDGDPYTFVVDEDGDIRTAEKDYENEDDEPLFSTKGYDFYTSGGAIKGAMYVPTAE